MGHIKECGGGHTLVYPVASFAVAGAAEPDESAESSSRPADLQQRPESSAALRLRGKNQSSVHAERDEGRGHL